MNMADRIQYLRKSKGISQEELADKVGVSRQEMCIRDSTIRNKFLFFAFLLYLLYGKEWLFVFIINGNIKIGRAPV